MIDQSYEKCSLQQALDRLRNSTQYRDSWNCADIEAIQQEIDDGEPQGPVPVGQLPLTADRIVHLAFTDTTAIIVLAANELFTFVRNEGGGNDVHCAHVVLPPPK
ncbi:MAG: hypothetical protein A2122_00260 [Candidatus Liptonbacteria bacterium GWB1_49_6]|uniref:Uncharacterized protein n=1 Tax=Candidatus Liptonbacteria bacterium GWB1_49_6 TaxID=1798644 RepID=A0A1G2C783_9BACT|nr:MAG: hypothetical protein A2122_00260 [Candidatus Liptonbacteria bacterium GWB1_49_6]